MNDCLPQKKHNPEGTHGAPSGEDSVSVGGTGWQCLVCGLLSGYRVL